MAAELKLPALKSLGNLADLRPVIIQDTREQDPLVFTRLQSVSRTLYSGDYLSGSSNASAKRGVSRGISLNLAET